MDKTSREQNGLEGAEALLFFNVPREHGAKLEVSPAADSRAEGVVGDGWWEGSWMLTPLSWRRSDPA